MNPFTSLQPPWPDGPSAYDVLEVDPTTGRLVEGVRLPDDGITKWEAGAADGASGHHRGVRSDEQRGRELLRLVEVLVSNPSSEALARLYGAVVEEPLLAAADTLEAGLRASALSRATLANLGIVLATRCPRREFVKLGILALGVAGRREDASLLERLAAHEELTLYAAQALAHVVDDPETCLLRVARRVHGWGRIQVVERLARSRRTDVRAWLLREGFRNSLDDSYSARVCAEGGELAAALTLPMIDDTLFVSAGRLLAAMAMGGPAPGLKEYADAAAAIECFLVHVNVRRMTPTVAEHLYVVRGALLRGSVHPDTPEARRTALVDALAETILASEEGRNVIRKHERFHAALVERYLSAHPAVRAMMAEATPQPFPREVPC
jgi:hypothetical protein